MKKFYIAGIVPESMEEGGGYSVYIPDMPQVAAGGENVAEAIANATSALYLALRGPFPLIATWHLPLFTGQRQ